MSVIFRSAWLGYQIGLTAFSASLHRLGRNIDLSNKISLPLSIVSNCKATMLRETEPSLNERQFTLQALQENQRIDGRAFDQFRDLDISFGDEYGVVNVTLGNTRWVHLQPLPRPDADSYLGF